MLSSVPALNEKILRHNSELTSYISHLMSEKHELHNIIDELQNTIATYREEDGLNEVILTF